MALTISREQARRFMIAYHFQLTDLPVYLPAWEPYSMILLILSGAIPTWYCRHAFLVIASMTGKRRPIRIVSYTTPGISKPAIVCLKSW